MMMPPPLTPGQATTTPASNLRKRTANTGPGSASTPKRHAVATTSSSTSSDTTSAGGSFSQGGPTTSTGVDQVAQMQEWTANLSNLSGIEGKLNPLACGSHNNVLPELEGTFADPAINETVNKFNDSVVMQPVPLGATSYPVPGGGTIARSAVSPDPDAIANALKAAHDNPSLWNLRIPVLALISYGVANPQIATPAATWNEALGFFSSCRALRAAQQGEPVIHADTGTVTFAATIQHAVTGPHTPGQQENYGFKHGVVPLIEWALQSTPGSQLWDVCGKISSFTNKDVENNGRPVVVVVCYTFWTLKMLALPFTIVNAIVAQWCPLLLEALKGSGGKKAKKEHSGTVCQRILAQFKDFLRLGVPVTVGPGQGFIYVPPHDRTEQGNYFANGGWQKTMTEWESYLVGVWGRNTINEVLANWLPTVTWTSLEVDPIDLTLKSDGYTL